MEQKANNDPNNITLGKKIEQREPSKTPGVNSIAVEGRQFLLR